MKVQNALFAALLISSLILALELVGGLLYGSVALIADASHVTTDIFTLALSFVALKLAAKPPAGRLTYGYHRIEVVAGLVNGLSLVAIAGVVVWEAYLRFISPVRLDVLGTVAFASFALILNLVSSTVVRRAAGNSLMREDINVAGAQTHILGDALSSLAVIAGAVAVFATGESMFDPLVAVFIGALVLNGGLRISRKSMAIMIDRSPIRDMKGLGTRLAETDGITEVHDLHVWRICSHITVASLHACLSEKGKGRRNEVAIELENKLVEAGIQHTTVQLEDVSCVPSHVHRA